MLREVRKKSKRLTRLWIAYSEGIARERFSATAYRIMIDYLTICILSTRAWAWILAFVIQTCLCQWTVGTDHTFWFAGGWATN